MVDNPQYDLMHPNSGEPNFNESMYFNFYDRSAKLGGFVRLGNRPNEGYAEMTLAEKGALSHRGKAFRALATGLLH